MSSSYTRSFRILSTDNTTIHSRTFGRRGAIASEHVLSAVAGLQMLQNGGNAIDAAVAATLVEGVVNPQMHTIGGECPILIHCGDTGDVVCINGNMIAPGAATPENFRRRGLTAIPPEGVLAAGVPGAFGALVEAMVRFGSMQFAEVVAPALALARDGFPAHVGLIRQHGYGVAALAQKFRTEWPDSAKLYLHDSAVPAIGSLIFNAALGDTFQYLADMEKTGDGSREEGLRAVYRAFYEGEVAREIAAFVSSRDGLLTHADMSRFSAPLETTASIEFHGAVLHKCGPWTQGPALLQALSILKNFDLRAMGHNSADYLHTVIEAVKLAWADREQFYADPACVDIPIETLLSDHYGLGRSKLVTSTASDAIRPGDPWRNSALLPAEERLGGTAWGPGTVHVDVMDEKGNTCAMTPSGAWIRAAEVIPALGFPLGTRLSNCQLLQGYPNVVAPYKRPRTTISPSLAMKDNKAWLAFGSMGGDQQDQWQLQFYLNRLVFDMNLQEAIEAPRFSSDHFPAQFFPHEWAMKQVRIEPEVGQDVLAALGRMGHAVDVAPSWTEGFVCATERFDSNKVLEAACDPRGARSEIFPACALAF